MTDEQSAQVRQWAFNLLLPALPAEVRAGGVARVIEEVALVSEWVLTGAMPGVAPGASDAVARAIEAAPAAAYPYSEWRKLSPSTQAHQYPLTADGWRDAQRPGSAPPPPKMAADPDSNLAAHNNWMMEKGWVESGRPGTWTQTPHSPAEPDPQP